MAKITEKTVAGQLCDDAHVLVTQQSGGGEVLRRVPLAVLLKRCGIACYGNFSDAISDINTGGSSNAGKGCAVAVVTAHTGALTVVLLEDVTVSGTVAVSASLDIALNGHVLRLTGAYTLLQFAADTDCTVWGGGGQIIKDGVASDSNVFFVRADGARLRFVDCDVQLSGAGAEAMLAIRGGGDLLELEGGSVSVDNTGDGGARVVQVGSGEALLRRCDLRAACIGTKTGSASYDAIVLHTGAKVTADHCHMAASSQRGYADTLNCRAGADTTLRDTTIEAITHTDGANALAHGVSNIAGAVLRIEGGKILADAPGDGISEDASVGITNSGTAYLVKAEISATHSGISNFGELYVDGGKYTGYSHGGIYFAHGADGVAYINDATLRDGNYEGIFADIFAGDTVMPLGGFYVGGGAEANHSNITVYLDGCTIDTVYRAFVLRNSSGEANNTVNLSNCTIVDPENHPMRIDTDTMRVNIGIGCNFTPDNAVADDEGEDASAWVHLTDELYRRKHGGAVCSGKDFEALLAALHSINNG